MTFNSLTYLIFLAAIAPLIALGPTLMRGFAILLGSLAFYGFWRIDFLALVVIHCLIDYTFAIYIADAPTPKRRKLLLILDLIFNVAMLGWFKYAHFIANNVVSLLEVTGVAANNPLPPIVLPIGISFYTFHTMSYTIDVYRGAREPVRNPLVLLSYVMFFPQLVAGPVLRVGEVVPQIVNRHRPNATEVAKGIEEIIAGLFKKAVLADGIAPLVDAGFARPTTELGTLDVWTLAFAFGLQIYFDFSGYSQIAIGSARVMGFSFPENFNWPYLATSPRDFWQRWHISLSSWIRDYLYLPLQRAQIRGESTGGLEAEGERSITEASRTRALFLTWAVMGLWHGANWTFVLWGLWHATFIWLYRRTESQRESLAPGVRTYGGWVFTLAYGMLAWILFRATDVRQAVAMLARAFDPTHLGTMALREMTYLTVFMYMVGLLGVAGIAKLGAHADRMAPAVRPVTAALSHAIMIFAIFLMLRPVRAFIYFQF